MIEVSGTAIDYAAVIQSVASSRSGAVATFDGRVRDHSEGRRVTHLLYEAYPPMAIKEMTRIIERAHQQFQVEGISAVHRIGELQIGESSVFIAVSAAHRRAAFEACIFVIDEIKKSVPIWKKEFFEDGEVWVEPPARND